MTKADAVWRPEEFPDSGWIVVRYVPMRRGSPRREVVTYRGRGPVIYGSVGAAEAECNRRNGT